MKTAIHGVETQFQVIGTGTPLVLLHGWGCDWQIWYPVISALSAKYQLILPDLPAFGASANPTTAWSSQDYVQWLDEFITQTLKTKHFYLAGHSFGGKLASLYASSASPTLPQLKKLMLIDSAGIPDILTMRQKLQQSVLHVVPASLKNAVPLSIKVKLLNMTKSATDHLNSTTMQRAILKKGIRENISQSLVKISVPTLLIWGKNDLDTPLHHAKKFSQYLPGSELHIFEKSGHFPFLDEPSRFIKELEEFCS